MKIHYTSPKEILKKRMGEIKMKIIENMRKKMKIIMKRE